MKESSRIKLKVPPPIVTFIFGVLMFCLDALYSVELEISVARSGLIATSLIVALFLLFPALIQFYKNKTTVNPFKPEKTNTLVVEGVYRYSRNPMYLGMALVLLAWGIFLSNPFNLILFFSFILYMNYFQIKPEEYALEHLFGEDFTRYKLNVRRWL
tara:strand:+ start:1413 stop:1883 length:471 start_codon:yes stop_codon:yes gene_type:complete